MMGSFSLTFLRYCCSLRYYCYNLNSKNDAGQRFLNEMMIWIFDGVALILEYSIVKYVEYWQLVDVIENVIVNDDLFAVALVYYCLILKVYYPHLGCNNMDIDQVISSIHLYVYFDV